MKLVFAGTPQLAAVILTQLLEHKFAIDLVLTKPDVAANRGQKLISSAVKQTAIANNITVLTPERLANNEEIIATLKQLAPDFIIVAAYGLIIPASILNIPKIACINVHFSLLPQYRGAAPIARSILAGDRITGVTIMQMDTSLDTGAILIQKKVPITDVDTSGTVGTNLAAIGVNALIEYLNNYQNIIPQQQDHASATYADKIVKTEAQINWQHTAAQIALQVRAFNPHPGCFSYLNGELVKIWQVVLVNCDIALFTHKAEGTIIAATHEGIVVLCGGSSALAIKQLQPEGKTKQTASAYWCGHQDILGSCFGVTKDAS